MDKKLGFDEIKQILTGYLRSVLEVYEYKITFARQLPDRWLINVSFKADTSKIQSDWTTTAAVSINSTTGELIEIVKNTSYGYS